MASDKEGRSGGGLAIAQLTAGMALFGSATPVSKIVSDASPVFVGATLRVAIGALVILPFAIGRLGGLRELERRDWLVLCGIALFGMFGFSVLMLYGMGMVPGVVGSVVMSTTPAITALAAFLVIGDNLGRRKVAAIALAVAGVALMHLAGGPAGQGSGSGDGAGAVVLGSALVLLAVCCEAAYTLLGKAAMDKLSPLVVTLMAAALSLPLFVAPAAIQLGDADFGALGWTDWLAVAWWGAGTLGLGSLLWYSGVAKVAGSTAAGFMGVMPVSALVLSYVLLGEPFRWVHLAGFAIVFAGVVLISLAHRDEARSDGASE